MKKYIAALYKVQYLLRCFNKWYPLCKKLIMFTILYLIQARKNKSMSNIFEKQRNPKCKENSTTLKLFTSRGLLKSISHEDHFGWDGLKSNCFH